MTYTIGEVSKKTGLSVATLRYYDKEGLFNNIDRAESGNRLFTDKELLTIKWIDYLKVTGMSLKDIKKYLDMNEVGDNTLQSRLELFNQREQAVLKHIKELETTMAMIQIKKWWYQKSIELGSEQLVRDMSPSEYPDDIYNNMIIAFGENSVKEK